MRYSPSLVAASLALLVTSSLLAASKVTHLEIGPADAARTNVAVKVDVAVPKELASVTVALLKVGDETILGQLTRPGLGNESIKGDVLNTGQVLRELHFVLPKLDAGQTLKVEAIIDDQTKSPAEAFAWAKENDTHIDLTFAGKPVARYMNEAYDNSTPENRERTYKVYHHVYHPATETLLTKGPGGRYTHHRGIFYGFSKVSYGPDLKKKADIWHCKGVSQRQSGVLASEAGPVLGRHRLAISWVGADNQLFASEIRELTFYNTPGGLLVEFASQVKAEDGKLKLDGDPQHAGFQFRASNDVAAKTAKQTYYIRPDGVAQPGSYKQGQKQPWNAMSFVLGDQRFTACYLDHADNPKPAFYSERDYGRFGSYFIAETADDKTIDVNYRLWIQPGEMDVKAVAAHAENFAQPPKVVVK